MKRKPNVNQFVIVFLGTCVAMFLVLEAGFVEQIAYSVQKGRLRAIRETLPDDDRLAELAYDNRRIAELVRPVVVAIETESIVFSRERDDSTGWHNWPDSPRDPWDTEEHINATEDGSAWSPTIRQDLGSGFVFDAEAGLVLTNAHVVQNATEVRVFLADGRRCSGEVLGQDLETDLAVIRIELDKLHELPIGDSRGVAVGDDVFAVGNPFGLEGTVSKGIISAVDRQNVSVGGGLQHKFLQTDAMISPGSSGGPLVNMRGEVIGLNTAIATETGRFDGVGFAIPSSRFSAMLADLVNGGPGFLGVMVGDVSESSIRSTVQELGWLESYGVFVHQVMPGRAAERAGLRSKDIILSIDDRRVDTMRDLGRLVSSRPSGTEIGVSIWRNGEEIFVPVRIGGRYEPG